MNTTTRFTVVDAPTPGTTVNLTWTSVSNRGYYVLESLNLLAPSLWFDSGLGPVMPDGLTTTLFVSNTNAPIRFYRIQAFRPLMP